MSNRRSFLQRAAMAVAAIAIDPELLIWQPEKKAIFIPKTTYAEVHAVVDRWHCVHKEGGCNFYDMFIKHYFDRSDERMRLATSSELQEAAISDRYGPETPEDASFHKCSFWEGSIELYE